MPSRVFSRQMVHLGTADDLFTNTLHQGSTSRMKLWPREVTSVADKIIPAVTNSFSISSRPRFVLHYCCSRNHERFKRLASLEDYCTMLPRQGASSLCQRATMHDPRIAANGRVSARRVYTVARPPPLDSRADRPGTDCLRCCASAECSKKALVRAVVPTDILRPQLRRGRSAVHHFVASVIRPHTRLRILSSLSMYRLAGAGVPFDKPRF